MPDLDVRRCFAAAAEGFVTVVSGIGDRWSAPALGEWSVRDLVGHTSRALSTVETYLAEPPGVVVIRDPLEYLMAARGPLVNSAEVAQRGRDAGLALGDDPVGAVRNLVSRVTALVAASPDDAPVTTRLGCASLLAYLPTRTFELTVHGLDLVAALGADRPAVFDAPIIASIELAAATAARGSDAAAVLLALTGRRGLPAGFSVI
jgi:uncharacterized protein (TIGR03083 family)